MPLINTQALMAIPGFRDGYSPLWRVARPDESRVVYDAQGRDTLVPPSPVEIEGGGLVQPYNQNSSQLQPQGLRVVADWLIIVQGKVVRDGDTLTDAVDIETGEAAGARYLVVGVRTYPNHQEIAATGGPK